MLFQLSIGVFLLGSIHSTTIAQHYINCADQNIACKLVLDAEGQKLSLEIENISDGDLFLCEVADIVLITSKRGDCTEKLSAYLGYYGGPPCPNFEYELDFIRLRSKEKVSTKIQFERKLENLNKTKIWIGYIPYSRVDTIIQNNEETDSFSLHGAYINKFSNCLYLSHGSKCASSATEIFRTMNFEGEDWLRW